MRARGSYWRRGGTRSCRMGVLWESETVGSLRELWFQGWGRRKCAHGRPLSNRELSDGPGAGSTLTIHAWRLRTGGGFIHLNRVIESRSLKRFISILLYQTVMAQGLLDHAWHLPGTRKCPASNGACIKMAAGQYAYASSASRLRITGGMCRSDISRPNQPSDGVRVRCPFHLSLPKRAQ